MSNKIFSRDGLFRPRYNFLVAGGATSNHYFHPLKPQQSPFTPDLLAHQHIDQKSWFCVEAENDKYVGDTKVKHVGDK